DEARHDDTAGGVDLIRAARGNVRTDSENLVALDQHVRLHEVADLRVHRHDRAAANDVAPPVPAAVARHAAIRTRWTRCEQPEAGGSGARRRRTFEKIPTRSEMILWLALIA